MKKSTLKEVIKSEIKSLLLENQMDTDAAFKTLRTVLAFLKKHNSYPNPELMEKALDILQRDEVSRMMDREPSFKGTGERAGFDMRGIDESLNPEVGKELDEFLAIINKKYEYDYPHALDAIMAALEQQNINTKYDMPGFGDTMDALDDISIREEEEPTSAELKKKDSIAATSNKLQKLTKKMKDKAKEFKAAEGDAKDKIKDELKKMTKEKKQLEKAL